MKRGVKVFVIGSLRFQGCWWGVGVRTPSLPESGDKKGAFGGTKNSSLAKSTRVSIITLGEKKKLVESSLPRSYWGGKISCHIFWHRRKSEGRKMIKKNNLRGNLGGREVLKGVQGAEGFVG